MVSELPIDTISPKVVQNTGSSPSAPLIFNAWHVIALSREVGPELGTTTALGAPLVYFRAGLKMRQILKDIKVSELRGAAA